VRNNSNIRNEAAKARLIEDLNSKAADAYDRILTRYPLSPRADDAKAQLLALHRPVPRATKAMLAQNKAEIESRSDSGMVSHLMGNFKKHPDVAQATKVGEPTMVDPTPVNAKDLIQQASAAMAAPSDKNVVGVETVKAGEPPPNQPAPRSDTPAPETAPDNQAAAPADNSAGAQPAAGELTPNVPADANELKPNVQTNADDASAPPPPQQVNEIGTTPADSKTAAAAPDPDEAPPGVSSSKKKKKKGLHKLNPF
jgi:outer membrane protein assembly factor BamD